MNPVRHPVNPSINKANGWFAVVLATITTMFFSAPLWAQQESEPQPARPMIFTGMAAETIARNRPDSAVWLSGDDQERVLALFQPEQDTPARGALVIVSDEGVSAASGLADAIRGPLSKAGWGVMTLGLDAPPFAVQQWLNEQVVAEPGSDDASTESSDEKDESSVMINVMEKQSPDDALATYRDRVKSSITAAVNALQEREYERIVLAGIGRAAGHVTRQARADGRASDLVWIAPLFYSDESGALVELLQSAASPSILELYSTFPGDKADDRTARERAAALKRGGIEGYRRQPVAMSRRPEAREAHMLSNRISAWLSASQSE